jgi:dolichol-phosphate mannosyltransferase
MVDGDDTYSIEMATQMICLFKKYDVVIGSRLKGTIEPSAMTKLNVLGNVFLSLLAWALFRVYISDVCTGFWGYRSDAVRRLELAARGFEIEADMFAECVRNGLSIVEIPITYRARKDRPKLASLSDGIKIGFLCRRRLEQAYENVGQIQVENKTATWLKSRATRANLVAMIVARKAAVCAHVQTFLTIQFRSTTSQSAG